MRKKGIVTKLVTPHVADCSALRNWPDNPWAYFRDGEAVYRDALGRPNGSGHHRFIMLGCNSTACPARVLVRESDLTALVQQALPAPRPEPR